MATQPQAGASTETLVLVVRRTIDAPREKLFRAWTEPAQLTQWWGPPPARCPSADVDLRVGGKYRIANEFPDGRTVWIAGEFEKISPPSELVYTWQLEGSGAQFERVTVRFEASGRKTEVLVLHERIADADVRARHEQGWRGCLDGLARYAGTR
jgi:uncharacterized protein YndB with AHSA1/START domain